VVPAPVKNDGAPLVVIAGATGSGKGDLARELARRIDGELVLADSRKVIRGLDIGTAKPFRGPDDPGLWHLLDVCRPGEVFSAARFQRLADEAIAGIRGRGRVPIVVGGTGLFIRALLFGIIETPPRDEQLRQRLEAEEDAEPGRLHRRLAELDPDCARRLAASDRVRLVRALEVVLSTGRTMSDLQREHGFRAPRYRFWALAVDWPRDELYRRLEIRVGRMLERGWLDEVRSLRAALRGEERRVLQTLGYRELMRHLDGEWPLERAVEEIQRAHRRYARRQLAWFRSEPWLEWVSAPPDIGKVERRAREFLEGCAGATAP